MHVLSHNWLLKDVFLLTFLPSQKLYLLVDVREIFSTTHMWSWGELGSVVHPGGCVRLLVLSGSALLLWRTRKAQGKGWLSFISPQPRTISEAVTPGMLSKAAEPLVELQLDIEDYGNTPNWCWGAPSPGPSRQFSQHMPWPDCTQSMMITFRCGCSTTAGLN